MFNMRRARTIVAVMLAAGLVLPGGIVPSDAVLCLDEHGGIDYDAAGCTCTSPHDSHETTLDEAVPDAGPMVSSSLGEDDCGPCIDIPLPTLGIGKVETAVLSVRIKNAETKSANHEPANAWPRPETASSLTWASRPQSVDTFLTGLCAVSLRI